MKLIQALAAIPLIAPAFGAFALVDNMEGADNWNNMQGVTGLTVDPADSGNTVYFATSNATNGSRGQAYLTIPAIADGSTGTLFFRIRTQEEAGGLSDWIWGASDVTTPATGFNDYDGYGRISDGAIDVRNSPEVGGFSEVGAASAGTWYNVWLVLNNTSAGTDDTTDLYFNTSGDATSGGTLSFTGGVFRNEATDLVSLMVRNNEGGSIDAYIDDVYIDTTGQNLANPIPEPSVAVLLGSVGLLGLVRRRRAR